MEGVKKIHGFFPELRRFRSTKKLERSPLYQELKPLISSVLDRCEAGAFAEKLPDKKNIFRAVTWNIERGMVFDGVVEILEKHPEIAAGDIFFLPEADMGMARSQNRDVARDLAKALKMNYSFSPCYINLDKGNGVEIDVEGQNEWGIHGNAILSRWPLKNPRLVRLKNCKDKMRGKEKRLGSQSGVVVDVMLPNGPLRVVCIHLDAHSSQPQRYHQIRAILGFLEKEKFNGPTLIGGDWNTSTYHANHVFFVFFSFWRKVLMGVKRVCEKHYPYPERYFEKKLFQYLEKKNFDYKNFNALGVPTIHYQMGDIRKNKNLRDWIPQFFQPFVDWAMKKVEGKASLKVDWFAAKHLTPIKESQRVIANLTHNGEPISDHDAIMVDFKISG